MTDFKKEEAAEYIHEFNSILFSTSGYLVLLEEIAFGDVAKDIDSLREYVGELKTCNLRAKSILEKIGRCLFE
jgi:hypothetical protein